MELDRNTVAAVTGASRGIGRAVALALAGTGARLALTARSAPELETLQAEALAAGAAGVLVMPADLRDPATPDRFIAAVLSRWGRLDAVINNAGIGMKKPVRDLTDEDWSASLETNLTAPFRMMRRAIDPMLAQGGGHIINVASIAAEVGFADGGAYCAAKFGLRGLAECLALEVRREGIKITTLEPGSVDTRFDPTGGDSSWKIPPAEIARTILYLLTSPDHVMVTKLEIRPTLRGKP